jgi:hypothetical protein
MEWGVEPSAFAKKSRNLKNKHIFNNKHKFMAYNNNDSNKKCNNDSDHE